MGGKGGVGKTTCAAAFAIDAALGGQRVLVVSTDPAPSLGDALARELSGSPRRVPTRRGELSAVEIDAPAALQRWLDQRRDTLEKIALEGTWLDREDVATLLRLSLPGIDELAALLEIARLADAQPLDLVVVDTAPTGHTLRMLAMPETLLAVAGVFDRMRDKRRVVEAALTGGWNVAAEDQLIADLARTAERLRHTLRDGTTTHTWWVTLAEPMALAETSDAVSALKSAGIPVGRIIANRMTPAPHAPCGHCDARQSFERRALKGMTPGAVVVAVDDTGTEPRGIRALASIGSTLRRAQPLTSCAAGRGRRWRASLPSSHAVVPASLVGNGCRLVLLGGKGGVGKTTCAAALALSAAARWPGRRVLLISTDPAHSLADVFQQPIGDTATLLASGPKNLHVRELDAARVFGELQHQYLRAIDAVFDRMRGGSAFDVVHDRAVMRSLIELAPPGLDEVAAVIETIGALALPSGEWDMVVMDTAPTGHALRLIEMPALVQDWTKALMAILLKYQAVASLGQLATLLVTLSKGIRALRDMLQDGEQAAFVAVTRAAALPRLETVRLCEKLAALGIHVPAVVVNAVGPGTCGSCRAHAVVEGKELAALGRGLGRGAPALVIAPAQVPPPAGTASIREWARRWREPPVGRPASRRTTGSRAITSPR